MSSVYIQAGADNTDTLFLYGGNSADDGNITIRGDSGIDLRAGNGNFQFFNGATSTEIADLSSTGTLQLDGNLSMDGISTITATGNGDLRLLSQSNVMRFSVDSNNDSALPGAHFYSWYRDTSAFVDDSLRIMQLQSTDTGAGDGDLFIDGQLTQNAVFDIAESFYRSQPVEPGEIGRASCRDRV